MTTATNHTPQVQAWQADICERRIYVKQQVETDDGETKIRSKPLDLVYVVLQRGEQECIPFCVCRRKSGLTLSDRREELTGAAGTDGLWNSRTPQKRGRRRSLTPTAWVAEVSRFIGAERAREILRLLGA